MEKKRADAELERLDHTGGVQIPGKSFEIPCPDGSDRQDGWRCWPPLKTEWRKSYDMAPYQLADPGYAISPALEGADAKIQVVGTRISYR